MSAITDENLYFCQTFDLDYFEIMIDIANDATTEVSNNRAKASYKRKNGYRYQGI